MILLEEKNSGASVNGVVGYCRPLGQQALKFYVPSQRA